jgi:competence protein ComEC
MGYIRKHILLIVVIALSLFTVSVWLQVFFSEPRDFVEVSFLDVGQGDALLIEGRSRNQVLIDAGSGPVTLRRLSEEMSFFDRFLDVVIETHPDNDHIGGLPAVLSRFGVGAYIEPGVDSENSADDEVARILERKNTPTFLARKGGIVDLGDGSYIEILFPDRNVSGLETNMASVVARYVYGDTCFLLTGDTVESIEEYLVSLFGSGLSCQVLKVGHHGSNTSTAQVFLSAVSPEYAVVSAGHDNRYGHPHEEVMARLQGVEISILETAKEGTITFTSDGQSVRKK